MAGSPEREASDKSVILVAVDLSPVSRAVLETALRVTGTRPTELHLLHVLQPQPPELATTLHFATVVEQTKVALDSLAHDLPESVVELVIHVRAGDAANEIIDTAGQIGADLAVVGTHGYKGLDRLLLGSVAETLVRRAPCPVLTYRPGADRLEERIEPPCPDCVDVRRATGRVTLWCERHSQHHPRAHTYRELPDGFGLGSQLFR